VPIVRTAVASTVIAKTKGEADKLLVWLIRRDFVPESKDGEHFIRDSPSPAS